MIKEKKSLKGKIPSRRKFFKAAAATGAAATAAVAMPNLALGDGHVTLKMQAAWPTRRFLVIIGTSGFHAKTT